MKKTVIVGAGPNGLLLLILLVQQGYTDITIVDPRLDEYTRNGILDKTIFTDLLSTAVGQTVTPSVSAHIKDAERSLYEIAKKLNVQIRKASFEGFEGKAVRIKYENNTYETLPCDLVVDASGSKRVVVNAVNKVKPNSFNIEPIDNLPVKDHLIAYVKISNTDRDVLRLFQFTGMNINNDTLAHVKALEEIRAMGWQGFLEPTFYFQLLEKDKACFYVEVPDNLDSVKLEEWLKKVLTLKTGKEDFTFQKMPASRKHPRKNRFNTFQVDPQKVKEAYYIPDTDDLPCLILVGDAHVDPDYRLGIGIKRGADGIKQLLKCFKLLDPKTQEFEIDFIQYESLLKNIIADHENTLTTFYAGRRNQLINVLQTEKSNYDRVMSSSSFDKSILASYHELAFLLYQEGVKKYESALNTNGEIAFDNFGLVKDENKINEGIQLIEQALAMLPIDSAESKSILLKLNGIALKFKELGAHFYNKKSFGYSMRYYSQALSILQTHFGYSEKPTIVKLQSNCVISLCKSSEYKRAVKMANEALKIIHQDQASIPDSGKLLVKLYYHKAQALMYCIQRSGKTSTRQEKLEECKRIIEALERNRSISELELKTLKVLWKQVSEEKPEVTKGFLL